VLGLARAWRATADWRDWLGRWLGWCWLLSPVLQIVTTVL
jgi:hypothetical protein